jgi:hypothetical protein
LQIIDKKNKTFISSQIGTSRAEKWGDQITYRVVRYITFNR